MLTRLLLFATLVLCCPSVLAAADASVVTLLRQSQQAAARGQTEQAMELVTQALSQDPAYPPLWRQKATLQLAAGDVAGALETLAVALRAEPGNLENNVLELSALLRLPGGDNARLERFLAGIREGVAAALLAELLPKPQSKADLVRFLAAWNPNTPDGRTLHRLAAGYVAGDPGSLRTLADATPPATSRDAVAALQFYAGKACLDDKRLDLAAMLLEKAQANGFDAVAVTGELGWVRLNQGEPAAAAGLWESQWRNAPNVGHWASWIADAWLAAKNYPRAAEFLEKTLDFVPQSPVYQGQYLFALRKTGQDEKADAFEAQLRDAPDQDGLHFGLGLVAWGKADYEAAAEDFRQIQNRELFHNQRLALANAMVAQLDAKTDPARAVAPIEALIEGLEERPLILRDIGWQLWGLNRQDIALAYWKQALAAKLPPGDPLLSRVVPLLIETGRLPEAMALLHTYAPEVTPLGLAWTLAAGNRWELVGKVLGGVPAAPYPDLLAAMAALHGGQAPVALEKMRALASLPADGLGKVPFTGFNADGQIVRGVLAPALARDLYLRLVRTVVDYQVTAGFFFLTPPAWAATVAPADMAPVWATAGKVLWNTGNLDDAGKFLQQALDAAPGQEQALLYLALVKKRQGQNEEAKRLLDAALVKASPFDRAYALGEFALIDGDNATALARFQTALSLSPADGVLRLRVVSLLVAADRFDEARRTGRWFEEQAAKGNKSVLSATAAARLSLGDAKGAETLYRSLLAENPSSLDYLSGLGLSLNRQSRYAESVAALSAPYAASGSSLLGGVVCDALMALGEYRETIRQAEIGLAQTPNDKELLRQAAEAAEFARDPALCADYAGRSLSVDPNSVTMQNRYGQALLDQEKYDEAMAHYKGLLDKDPVYVQAMRGIFNIYQYTGAAAKAYDAAQTLMTVASDNATLRLQYAIAAAADHDYRPAFPTLEKIRAFGPGSPVLCLYYGDVRDAELPGRVRLSQLADHLRAVAAAGGAFLSPADLAARPAGEAALAARNADLRPNVLVLVDRTSAPVLEKIDAVLAEVGGRAVLVVGGESLVPGTPYLPDIETVKRLAATGRWTLALTDHNPPALPDGKGDAVGLWTAGGAPAGAADKGDADAAAARLTARLHALDPSGVILGDAKPVFFYPGGDAPNEALGADAAGREAYAKVVGDTFAMAFELTPEGYWTPVSETQRIASKSVSPTLDAAGLTRLLQQTNPMRQVSLELAKVYSWQEQLGQAENYYKEAAALQVNPADLSYHSAVNAYYLHDDPVAVSRAEQAVAEAPDAERAQIQLGRAKLRTRPKAEVSATTWWDSDNRRYWWFGMGGDVHVRDSLVVFAKAGRVEWSLDSYQRRGKMLKAIANTLENGYLAASDVSSVLNSRRNQYLDGEDLVVGARWFFATQFWLEAQGQLTRTDSGPGTWPNAQATLHGPFAPRKAPIDGTWDLQAAYERIDTVEAIAEQIMANRVSLFTHNRVFNYYDLFLNLHGISRTDGNNSGFIDGRLLARLFEFPLVSLGYAFQFANSDRNPPQYWAPLDLATHLAYGSFGYAPARWFNVSGSLGYGPSRDRNNDWRNIWRANAGMDITLEERLKFSVKYSYSTSSTYNLNTVWAAISYTF